MRRICFLLVMLMMMGMTGCGKEASESEIVAQEQTTESATQEQTEVDATEATTQEKAEATTVEQTEAPTMEQAELTTERGTEELDVPTSGEVSTEIALEDQTGGTLTPDEALKLIEKTLGTKDEEMGYTYTFGHINTMTVDGSEYHVFMWGWIVDDHMSRLTDLFVKTDGSAIYEGTFLEGATTVYTETNFLE